ncbi:MAG: carboxypeptidase-like regulatory domain-containing protein, partial [Cyclobacteriaceae bacterium]
MRLLLSLSLFFSLLSAFGQDSCSYFVEGRIYDLSTKEPLPFVNVQVVNSSLATGADHRGYFRINNICQAEFDLLFTHIGYKKVVHHHDVHHKLPEIFLAPDQITLEGVVIEAEKLEEYVKSLSTEKISGKEYRELNTGNLADLASNFSGVSSISAGQNVSKPIIHGLHSNRVVIVNNGVRHEFQNWGQEHAPEIDPD